MKIEMAHPKMEYTKEEWKEITDKYGSDYVITNRHNKDDYGGLIHIVGQTFHVKNPRKSTINKELSKYDLTLSRHSPLDGRDADNFVKRKNDIIGFKRYNLLITMEYSHEKERIYCIGKKVHTLNWDISTLNIEELLSIKNEVKQDLPEASLITIWEPTCESFFDVN